MKKMEVLGTGCPKCLQLYDMAQKAILELGVEYTLTKVMDLDDILDYGVMMTPALVIDGKVKAAGKVPNMDELKVLLSS
ncbi:TM0996/MTH895 family glutaredoxin-like protein [bacterium]|nr:TM0996/MTH895 family glutaredoxin-like protein [bacterium]